MKIKANVQNSQGQHHVTLTANDNSHSIIIPPNPICLFFAVISMKYLNRFLNSSGRLRAPSINATRMRM